MTTVTSMLENMPVVNVIGDGHCAIDITNDNNS